MPATMVVGEAGWVSLLLGAWATGSHASFGFVFLRTVLVALAAVVTSGVVQRIAPRNRRRVAVPVSVVVGAALCAGVLTGLSSPAGFGRGFVAGAFPPGSTGGHEVAVVIGLSWVLAAAAWVRGAWLTAGYGELTGTLRSLFVAGAVFLIVFVVRTASPHGTFAHGTSDVGALFFVTFPLLCTAAALVRQRDLAYEAMGAGVHRPSGAWFAILAGPMAAVAVGVLLLAVVGGFAARPILDGLLFVVRLVLRGLGDLLSLIPGIHFHLHSPSTTLRHLPVGKDHGRPARTHTPTVILVVLYGTAGLVLSFLLAAVGVMIWRRLRRPVFAYDEGEVEEEVDSVFGWRSFWQQLRKGLAGWLGRLRRRVAAVGRRVAPSAPIEVDAPVGADLDGVRAAYRRLLVSARGLGVRRRRVETTRELEVRLGGFLDGPTRERLSDLTDAYDGVRYGERAADPVAVGRARDAIELVSPALQDALRPPEAHPA